MNNLAVKSEDIWRPLSPDQYGSLMVELVHETIKYGLAPLGVGPEFALNSKVWLKTLMWIENFQVFYYWLQVGNCFSDFGPLFRLRTLGLNFASRHPFPELKKVPQMEYCLESWWVNFVWWSGHSFHCVRMGHHWDPEKGINWFTHRIYTQEKF